MSHNNQPYAPNKTDEMSIACYHLLPHTHLSPSLWWCRSLCQKWELFLVKPQVRSQWTVLVEYLTISTNVNWYQTSCQRQYCLSATQLMHAPVHGVRNTVQQLLRKTRNFIFSWAMDPTGQSWTHLIATFRESTATYTSCISTKLKKSSSDWLNSGKAVIQHLSNKMHFLCFHVSPVIAEALVG